MRVFRGASTDWVTSEVLSAQAGMQMKLETAVVPQQPRGLASKGSTRMNL